MRSSSERGKASLNSVNFIPKQSQSESASVASSSENVETATDRVRVLVRVRPLSVQERNRGRSVLQPIGLNGIQVCDPTSFEVANRPELAYIDPKCWARNYSFDHVLWSVNRDDTNNFATQETVYETIGQPVVNWAIDGHNSCVFAYGQTGEEIILFCYFFHIF